MLPIVMSRNRKHAVSNPSIPYIISWDRPLSADLCCDAVIQTTMHADNPERHGLQRLLTRQISLSRRRILHVVVSPTASKV